MVESKDHLDPHNSEQVLSSFHEWMVQQAQAAKSPTGTVQPSDLDNGTSAKSASIAPELSIKSSVGGSQEHPIDPSKQANVPPGGSNRSSFETRVLRAICGLLVVVAGAAAWQAHGDDQTMKLVQAWERSSLIWLSDALGAALGTNPPQSEAAAQPTSAVPDQARSTPAVTSMPTKEFAELNGQLQTVANDLVVLRRNVEQLTAKQEQISRDILTVQATEQNVSEKISSLTQAAAPVHAPPRKSVDRLVRSEAPRQPAPASVSSQPPAAATASPIDQPPRPPLPLPAPVEAPSPLH